MICPYCSHDNIAGEDVCAECGQSLVGVGEMDSVLVKSITTHAIDVLNPRQPAVVEPGASLREAVREMEDKHIGCLVVVQDKEMVGIVTERDVLNKVDDDLANLDQPVSQFMTADPTTIDKRDSIAYALHTMDLGGYRHLPIVDEKRRPSGIISVRDILRYLCIRFADSRSDG